MRFSYKELVFLGVMAICWFNVNTSYASDQISQSIHLAPGWNIVSTPKVLASHTFSVAENATNFDIYVLDASFANGWATMADLGQSEFTPLFGYFVNNKTGINQTLTFNYKTGLSPDQKLFERTFTTPGWYSFGVANDTYAVPQSGSRTDANNPSKVLSLLEGKYDTVIDFTNAVYASNRKSVALSNPWRASVAEDIDYLNDLRETKGYAIYIKQPEARYNGFQNDPVAVSTTSASLNFSLSPNNPDATYIVVDDDSKTNDVTVLEYQLQAGDGDVEVGELAVQIETSTTSANIIDDVTLNIGGQIFEAENSAATSSKTTIFTFNLGSAVMIFGGELATAQVLVDLKSQRGNYAQTIQAEVTEALVKSTVAKVIDEQLSTEQLTGEVVGNRHTLVTTGIMLANRGTSATVTVVDGATNDYGTYILTLDVTAFNQDVYISNDPAVGVSYSLVDGAGAAVATGTRSAVLTSSAEEDGTGSYFLIPEGSTKTLTLTVTYTAGIANTAARLQLNSVKFDETAVTPTQTQATSPVSDYRTDVVTIVG